MGPKKLNGTWVSSVQLRSKFQELHGLSGHFPPIFPGTKLYYLNGIVIKKSCRYLRRKTTEWPVDENRRGTLRYATMGCAWQVFVGNGKYEQGQTRKLCKHFLFIFLYLFSAINIRVNDKFYFSVLFLAVSPTLLSATSFSFLSAYDCEGFSFSPSNSIQMIELILN